MLLSALISATVAWASPGPAEPPAATNASPAIYAIRDSDTTIYVFGTFHVLDSGISWFGGPVEQAFEQADELVVETIPPDRRAAAKAPAPLARAPVTTSANFLATTQMAVKAGQAEGMKLDNGADMVLLRAAAAEGKPVEQLETLQSQFAMLARIPTEAAQPASRSEGATPAPAATLPEAMTTLQSAWSAGEHGLFAEMLGRMRQSSPQTYRIMFTERNARWADWVSARMRTPGTVFVAVGAGHLAGPDSLLVRLAQRGFISRRVL